MGCMVVVGIERRYLRAMFSFEAGNLNIVYKFFLGPWQRTGSLLVEVEIACVRALSVYNVRGWHRLI